MAENCTNNYYKRIAEWTEKKIFIIVIEIHRLVTLYVKITKNLLVYPNSNCLLNKIPNKKLTSISP